MNTENNKIISEFMGLELEETPSGKFVYARNEFNNPNKGNDCQTNFYEANELCFHSDWNWLMEVVEKIENLQYFFNSAPFIDDEKGGLTGEYFCIIQYKTTNLSHCDYFIDVTGCSTKIQAVYNACVEFIKWYNDENNS